MTGAVAHLNVGYLRAPRGDLRVAEFWDNVERVNTLAERWPGFVVNVPFEDHELAPAAQLFDEVPERVDPTRLIATLSSWQTARDLLEFATKGVHGEFRARRETWFEPLSGPTYVIWPVASGHIPDLAEALRRLTAIRAHGPNKDAYDFKWLNEKAENA